MSGRDPLDLSVIGLGKLGAPLAALLAAKGHRVTGIDLDPLTVQALQAGQPRINEPQLEDYLKAAEGRLQATTDAREARASVATFLVVPTPSDAEGRFSCDHLLDALHQCAGWLAQKSEYHLFVVVSTVSPGAMDSVIRPALEQAAGRPLGPSLGLCYNPEFIALGSVIHDMLRPDLVLIGESDAQAGELLEALHRSLVENEPSIQRMSWINAELTKLAVNTFVTTKISYANMLAEMCERLPGGDIDVVSQALGSDHRIGRSYLSGGTGFGGPCFPRDNRALARVAADLGTPAHLCEATDRLNSHQLERLVELVLAQAAPQAMVGILGLAYKPGTEVTVESHGVALAARLLARGIPVIVHDPLAQPASIPALAGATVAETPEACWNAADLLVITLPYPGYRELLANLHPIPGGPRVVVDCWRQGTAGSVPWRALIQVGKSSLTLEA